MSHNPFDSIAEKGLEATTVVHHLFDAKHCKHIVEPLLKEVPESASKVVRSQALHSTSKTVDIVGKAVCEFDEQIASGVCSLISKVAPSATNTVKDVVKLSGPASVVIGMGFVLWDVAHASDHMKVERLGRGSAKVALTTGLTVAGTCIAGPVGALVFSCIGSFIGEALDPR
ncbi:MAG: hypothetical protein IM537_09715 [Pseudanabaena sp. M57BS1SP1A06MG]|nr:hypothetical protein [Pseudanabaena sp. M53BS1SP1A06MG]MCA6580833.1 hypothetical protein [Pseudanabaena sp. M34BS1SP1A06MG]MCA6592571.1 hypothetical protein [Pseudanabaena sp. M38BS1SP1A06MG]MCA6600465.1 hypothetical protein [Pseudanabaena sp. M57BS1SP1A06MG]